MQEGWRRERSGGQAVNIIQGESLFGCPTEGNVLARTPTAEACGSEIVPLEVNALCVIGVADMEPVVRTLDNGSGRSVGASASERRIGRLAYKAVIMTPSRKRE